MNEVELLALKLMRTAWSVLAGQASSEAVVRELNRLQRLSPVVFEQVVLQLERDNGRWAKASQLPNVKVNRNDEALVESIIFKSSQDSTSDIDATTSFTWFSDHAEKKWLEVFTQEVLEQIRKEPP